MGRVSPEIDVSSAAEARSLLAAYEESEDLIRVGAYSPGSDARTDRAVDLRDSLKAYLTQGTYEEGGTEAPKALAAILRSRP
jgi:flagellum-specific ATP synthase